MRPPPNASHDRPVTINGILSSFLGQSERRAVNGSANWTGTLCLWKNRTGSPLAKRDNGKLL
jgi:hypothetical protein